MKKVWGIVIVVIIVIVVGWIVLANRGSHNTNTSNQNNMSNMNMNHQSNNSSSPTKTNQVSIANFAFSPANISVTTGTTVTWTNHDSVAHTVTETDSQNGPKSSDIEPGKSFVFTFDSPGTYHYHCSIHTEMTGTVTVTKA